MRIAHVVSTYPPYHGGMGNVAAAMVSELQKRGHVCHVYTPDYDGRAPSDATVTRLNPWLATGNSAFVPQVQRLLEQGSYDVVHLHYPFFGGAESVAWFKRKHPRTRLVVTYHMDTVGKGLYHLFFSAYRAFIMPTLLRHADVITCSSLDYAQHSALAALLSKLPIVELPFGVDQVFQPPANRTATKDELRMLFVGGLDQAHYFKGLHVLFAAIQLLPPEDRGKIRLHIVGDGDRRSKHEQKVMSLGLGNQVQFLGKLEQKELIAAYQQADLTVLPSVDASEAFGLVLIESMACGTPVLASRLPGVRTVVAENEGGWTMKANDVHALSSRLHQILANPAVLSAMRSLAAERVNRSYRWPALIEQLEHLYQST